MRINLRKAATGYFAIALLLTYPLVSSETDAMPARNASTMSGIVAPAPVTRAQTRPALLDKSPVLARNSSAKAEPAVTTAAVKEQKTDDKKAIGRCWKRLMNMAREIRHAHTNTTK